MATLTIRNLDEALKRKLRVRAAQHDRSMEEEARELLRTALNRDTGARDLYAAIRRHVEPLGGIELELPPREPMRDPPNFDDSTEP